MDTVPGDTWSVAGGEDPLFVPFPTWPQLRPLWRLPRLGEVARFVSTCSFHHKGLREQFITATKPEDEPAYPYLGGSSFAQQLEIGPFEARWAGGWIRARAWADARAAGNALPDLDGVFLRPKLIIAQHATRTLVCPDPEGRWVTKDTYPVGWPLDPRWSLMSLAAVVASTAFVALYNTVFQGVLVGGETYHYLPAFLHQIPVPEDPAPIEAIAARVTVIGAHGQADLDAWDEVDRVVCAAYGLDEAARRALAEAHLHRVRAPAPSFAATSSI